MKVVFFAQHMVPMPTPRAHRTFELAKEFAKNGHEVIVYAVLGSYNYSTIEKENNLKIKRIPIFYQFHSYNSDNDKNRYIIDKISSKLFGKILEFPNIEFYFRIRKLIKNELNTDVVISIGDPHQIHWGVQRAKRILKEKFNSIWIADCGDPFMRNDKTKNHYHFFSRFEHEFCKSVDFITVPVKNAINEYYSEYRDKIRVIPQGFRFDLNVLKQPISVSSDNPVIKFAYAGLLHPEYRNPEALLELLSSLTENFEFHIYSNHHNLTNPFLKKMGSKLVLHSSIPRLQLMEKLESMDFLVNIENQNLPGQVPSKLIDYTILRKPILNIKPSKPNILVIKQFLRGDFSNRLKIENPEQYHISNVYEQFISLIDSK